MILFLNGQQWLQRMCVRRKREFRNCRMHCGGNLYILYMIYKCVSLSENVYVGGCEYAGIRSFVRSTSGLVHIHTHTH